MATKFLHESRIETAAYSILGAYNQKFSVKLEPPIQVDEIVESYLGLDFEISNLRDTLGTSDVLGATFIKHKKIVIDQSLDPSNDVKETGRYRFTVAHEIGHWQLHRAELLEQMPTFIETVTKPAIICRNSESKDPKEYQADQFASFLLMPEVLVKKAWKDKFGSLEPYIAVDEIAALKDKFCLSKEENIPNLEISKQLAPIFEVSAQAMQIRLTKLKLILTEVPPKGLFD
jgi:Zn-dependent peptidase ImmA (M78 family)